MLRRISEVAQVAAWTYDIQRDELVILTEAQRTNGVPHSRFALFRGTV